MTRDEHTRRTRNGRERQRRTHDRRAPTPQDVADALEEIARHDIPGTPPVSALRTLREVGGTSWHTEERGVRRFSIKRGDPQHGAHRSDDHISDYVVSFRRQCPECGCETAVYEYRAHHHIAGSEAIVCDRCDHVHHNEEWG